MTPLECHLSEVERFHGDASVEGSILSSAGLFMISLKCCFAEVLEYLNSLRLYNLSIQPDRILCSSYLLALGLPLIKNIFSMKQT